MLVYLFYFIILVLGCVQRNYDQPKTNTYAVTSNADYKAPYYYIKLDNADKDNKILLLCKSKTPNVNEYSEDPANLTDDPCIEAFVTKEGSGRVVLKLASKNKVTGAVTVTVLNETSALQVAKDHPHAINALCHSAGQTHLNCRRSKDFQKIIMIPSSQLSA